ncbi:MAG: hypothetical protein IPO92_04735 [Saprospiraceae bacterium]|nr:hypothetical protein [Saprospiraceae bacterium]
MKFTSVFVLIITIFLFSCGQETKNSKSESISPSKEQMRAKIGEEVWIIVSYIKNDSKSEFEKWIKEIFYPALQNSKNPMNKLQLNSTRWLEPAHQNEDKTWTYVWIMDPVVTNGDYDIPTLLNKEYGEAKGTDHWVKYQTFWAKPTEAHILKQTSY